MARARITPIDWIMLLLAMASIAMLGYETWGNPTAEQTRQILLADYIIIGIFALEFTIRWIKDERPKSFMWRNWYDLLGMIPVAHPAIRGFRLFRLVRIAVLLSRFARATDRALGQEFVFRLVGRFKGILVDSISGAVTLRVISETEAVMMKGRYAKNLADAIEQQGDDIMDIVVDKVAADPTLGRFRNVPFFDDVVGTSSRVTQRIMVETLRDDRMGDVIRDIIRQNLDQIKTEIARKERADMKRQEAQVSAT